MLALATLLGSLACRASPSGQQPTAAPRDPDAFTTAFAERMRREAPELDLQVGGRLQLQAPPPSEATVNLDRAYNVCITADAAACEDVTARMIASTREGFRLRNAPLRSAQLRIMVRSSEYCSELQRLNASSAPERQTSGTFRPVGPGLCGVLVLDFPSTMRSLNADDLRTLHLTADAAWALGERQVIGNRAASIDAAALDNSLVVFAEEEYIPSLMLVHDGWRRAVEHHGELVVAVPSDDHVIAMRRAAITDMAEFRAAVRDDFAHAERGISPSLYRWTPAGWELIP